MYLNEKVNKKERAEPKGLTLELQPKRFLVIKRSCPDVEQTKIQVNDFTFSQGASIRFKSHVVVTMNLLCTKRCLFSFDDVKTCNKAIA